MTNTSVKLRFSQNAFTVLLVITIAINASAFCEQKQPQPGGRTERWQQDLEFFAQKFPQAQKDFPKLFSPGNFRQAVDSLEHDVPQLSDSEIVLRLMRLVATAGVSHITVEPQGELQFHPYPLQLFWYSDGLAVTQSSEEYKAALGTRVVRIGSLTPEQLESAVAPYLSHENQSWLHDLSPGFMFTREVAEHFGLAGKDGSIEITFARPGTEQFKLHVAPGSAERHLISAMEALQLPTPLYRKRPDQLYWYDLLPKNHALYIQYSSCQNDPRKSFKDFTDEVFKFVDGQSEAEKIKRVIVDLRFNQGGDSRVIEPLVQGLQSHPGLSAHRNLFVLIGRATFSSGLMAAIELHKDLHAILIGEATGGRPNEYGELQSLTLPNSKIIIRYTIKYFHLLKDSDPSTLEPDVQVQRSLADFLSGRDPVLDFALQYSLSSDQSVQFKVTDDR